MKLIFSILLAGAFAPRSLASPPPQYGKHAACPADKCFSGLRHAPQLSSIASSFCSRYITRPTLTSTVTKTTTQTFTTTPRNRHTPTQTIIATQTSTVTVIPAQNTVSQSVTATSTATLTSTPDRSTITTTFSVTTQETVSSVCETSTVTSALPTSLAYRVRGQDPRKRSLEERKSPLIPKQLSSNCGSGQGLKAKISSACSCILPKTCVATTEKTLTAKTTVTASGYGNGSGASTVTTTITSATVTRTVTASAPIDTTVAAIIATSTITQTLTASQPIDATVSTTTTIASTLTSCSTSTVTTYGGLCGGPAVTAASYTTAGTYTCTQSGLAPGETNNRFRIEGGSEGNIYDGCIVSGPRNITTPSGGTRLCDGTNNNANPSPGGTFTTDIDSAGRLEGFDFDGTYSNQFQDFFISRISSTAQSGNQFWGVLRNRVFTAGGGCQEQVSPNDEGLWAYDAFAPSRTFLDLDRDYAVVRPGESVAVTVLAVDPNSGNSFPAGGATLGTGSVADANGVIVFTAPSTDGCYQYKAEMTNAIRSKAFYLSVIDSFGQ